MNDKTETEVERAAREKSAIEALTGADVGCEGISGSRTERLTARGAKDVIDRLNARGLEVVRRA